MNFVSSKQDVPVFQNTRTMSAYALPLRTDHQPKLVWTKKNPIRGLAYEPDEKEQMLIPVRELAWEITRQGHYKMSGEREWLPGKKSFFFLKNMRGDLNINGEAVKEYLLLAASHESAGKSFIASFHFPVHRGNRYTQKSAPLFVHPGNQDDRMQNAFRVIRQYESSRSDLYRQLNAFRSIPAEEEITEEIKHTLIHLLQKNYGKFPSYNGRGLITRINAFNSLLSLEQNGRKHHLLSLFNAVTTFTTHHLDCHEPANAEGIGAEINHAVMLILEREYTSYLAECYQS